VLEALGGPKERISTSLAEEIALAETDPLNLVAIEVEANAEARIVPLTPGLADEMFEHDGQITKREIRAITLSALAPRRGQLLWDIGAGCGSVAIEWMLGDPSLTAIAVEEDDERAERIEHNARKLGAPGLRIVHGSAPEALEGLPAPDAVFVGGGGSDPELLQAALDALRPGGRFVANAVTLETEAMLIDLRDSLGGAMTRIAVQRAEPIGDMTGWRPAMPVTQWVWEKPYGEEP
jgi:precorrin-6B C5,15-methyltransferase / cobalt-precorrin-6B C5,C15-methyltransferase